MRLKKNFFPISESTCIQIAQACDQKTAIGLARTNGVDTRLLLDPPDWKQPLDEGDLLRRVHLFLLKLDQDDPHPCIQVGTIPLSRCFIVQFIILIESSTAMLFTESAKKVYDSGNRFSVPCLKYSS